VEFVAYGQAPVYRYFAGSPLAEQADSGGGARTAAIEAMKVVRLP